MIRDDAEAQTIAEKHGLAEPMLQLALKQSDTAQAANVGVAILKRVANLLPDNRFEILVIAYFAYFLGDQNGWAVFGFTDVAWEELPYVVTKLLEAEKMLPEVMGTKTALERLSKVTP